VRPRVPSPEPFFFFYRRIIDVRRRRARYLEPARGDALVAWAAATFPAALVVAYDVVAPKTDDPFGRVMLANFRDRGAPLLGAAESLAGVRRRFGDAYAAVDVRDMRDVYRALVLGQPAEFKRVSALEISTTRTSSTSSWPTTASPSPAPAPPRRSSARSWTGRWAPK